jgi:hypothetical protein
MKNPIPKNKMFYFLFIILPIIALSSFSGIKSVSNSNINNSDSLAFYLCQLYGSDQTVREVNNSKEGVIIMQKTDSLNFIRLINFIKKYGYPNEKLLGKNYKKYECINLAAPAILLHNSTKVVKEDIYKLLKKEVIKGNMKPEALALILDKYYVLYKGYSLYNTQFKKACIENKNIVNKARLEIGLKKLPDSLFNKNCNKNEIIK